MKLFSYWRSSASYRVRIALALKQLPYQTVPVHLLNDGGEQLSEAYRTINPQQLLPALQTDEGQLITQSLAIIDYLDECYPEPALLPCEPVARARVRAMALAIACEIHPLNNLRVLNYLSDELAVTDDAKRAWMQRWIGGGLAELEQLIERSPDTGQFCAGSTPGLADICLVPQLYNARRFAIDLAPYPTLVRIDQACQALAAFQRAHPQQQADAP